ncbi:MAG: AmmeMemoRadiSam system radical SAM enzyme [Bacteroidales bacterium]|nr:AmmeMemoRadiSam system radical SAM enzyme [Bacteroidales bacterium]
MNEALYYRVSGNNIIECYLCPHNCRIREGKRGICGVRHHIKGKLIAETFGRASSVAIDPVEKKPLYHFYPSKQILSIGSFGCTMHCSNCQNSSISQCKDISQKKSTKAEPEDLERMIVENDLGLAAFTYNEPTVFYEFMTGLAKLFKSLNVKSVMVTNGYINKKPLLDLLQYIDAFNVDLKSFTDEFYRRITGAELKPVLDAMEIIKKASKHLEITFLVIPGLNDQRDQFINMIKYLAHNFGRTQVLHISRYFPNYKMNIPPTPPEKISEFVAIARENLDFVYAGNTGDYMDSNTYCPKCGHLLIVRNYYSVRVRGLRGNNCESCGNTIEGKF